MFNNNGPIVPKMPNKTGDTYAETKAEIEARKRAELAAEQAMLAAQNAAAEKQKKSPWLAILTILFAVIAIAGAGFAVYEHTENEKLTKHLDTANKAYSSASAKIDTLEKENTSLKETIKKNEANEANVPSPL